MDADKFFGVNDDDSRDDLADFGANPEITYSDTELTVGKLKDALEGLDDDRVVRILLIDNPMTFALTGKFDGHPKNQREIMGAFGLDGASEFFISGYANKDHEVVLKPDQHDHDEDGNCIL